MNEKSLFCILHSAFCILHSVIVSLVLLPPAFCAVPDTLSLNDCIAIALERSVGIRQTRQELMKAEADLDVARSPFYPNINLQSDLPDYSERTDRLQSDVLQGILSTTETSRYYRGGLNINQSIPLLGNINIASNFYRWDLTSTFRQNRREFSGDIGLWYRRVLLDPAPSDLALRQVRLRFDAAHGSFRWNRSDLIYRTTASYFGLLRAIKQVEIAKGKVAQSRELYETARKKFEAGLIAEVEALRLQVEMALAESNLSSALLNVERAKDDLRNLLGLDLNSDLTIRQEILYRPVTIDTVKAFDLAQKRRSDLQAAHSRYRLQKLNFDQTRREGYPKGEMTAYYGLKGIGDDLVDVRETFDPNRWGVRFQLRIPVWDAGLNRARTNAARADLLTARLNLEDQERRITLDVKDAIRRIEEAKRRIDILAASVDVAKKSFEITQKRFEIGSVMSKDLIDQQFALTQALTDNLNAIIDYYLAVATLERATMATVDELLRR